METLEIKIEGMACGDCISKVIRKLTAIPDVKVKKCIVLKPGLNSLQLIGDTFSSRHGHG